MPSKNVTAGLPQKRGREDSPPDGAAEHTTPTSEPTGAHAQADLAALPAHPSAAAAVPDDSNPFAADKWFDAAGGLKMSLDVADMVLEANGNEIPDVRAHIQGKLAQVWQARMMNDPKRFTASDLALTKQYVATAARQWDTAHMVDPLAELKKRALRFHGRDVLMHSSTKDAFSFRLREWPVVTTLLPQPSSDAASRVLVVAGESGAGKTYNALLLHDPSQMVLYLTLRDVTDAGWHEGTVAQQLSNGTMDTTQRDAAALAAVQKAVRVLVPGAVEEAMRQWPTAPRPSGFVLIVDEVGSAPQLLRALCALQLGRQDSGRGLLKGFPLRVVAVGTGVDALGAQPGSLPETFELVHVRPAGDLWKCIVADAANGSALSAALGRMSKYRKATDLATNARLAVLIAMHTNAAAEALAAAAGQLQLQQLMDQVLRAAVAEFRSLNGLSVVKRKELCRALWHAVRLVVTNDDGTRQSPVELELTHKLCTAYGILTDHATVEKTKPTDGRSQLLREMKDGFLVAPLTAAGKCHRFQLSPAQLTLLHMMYGFNQPPASGGGEFELLVARYLELVLIACRGGPVGALLRRVGLGAAAGEGDVPGGTLDYGGVAVVRTPPLGPDTPQETADAVLAELEEQVQTSAHAVVAINGDQAPFADVMVVVPGRLLLLVQCKNYAGATAWGLYGAHVELHKMGAVDAGSLAADTARRVSPAEAKQRFPGLCGRGVKNVPRQAIFEHLKAEDATGDDTPAAKLVRRLAVLAGGGKEVPVRRCLVTTKPALPGLPADVLQMHATEATMWPLVPRVEAAGPPTGARNEVMNLFLFEE
ncbi:MAG: hypothetical protein COA68_12400 [Oceanobacter sp.]|nr:MAG: hypothetical protein COA68_12400 [Oceanobacter sp.]